MNNLLYNGTNDKERGIGMAKLVGFKHVTGTGKKSGKPFDAYIVSYIEQDMQQGAYGYTAEQQFVNKDMFLNAVGNRDAASLLNSECSFVYNRQGFLDGFTIAEAKKA